LHFVFEKEVDITTIDGKGWGSIIIQSEEEHHDIMPVYEPPIEPENMEGSPPHECQTIDPLYKNHPKWVNYSNPLIKKLAQNKVFVHGKGCGVANKGIGKPIKPQKRLPYDLTGIQEVKYRHNGLHERSWWFHKDSIWGEGHYKKTLKRRNAVKESSRF
jgi:hypothetical protein